MKDPFLMITTSPAVNASQGLLLGPCRCVFWMINGELVRLARDGVSREVPCSALKGETVPDSLPARGPDPSSKATLWVKAQHEGALPPPCIVRKDPRVPHTARRGA